MLSATRKPKVCLLDFDGVVLRNPMIHRTVKKKVVEYVQDRAKIKDSDRADQLNQYLYTKYGHTMIGLNNIYGKEVSGTLENFNQFVYENLPISSGDFFSSRKEINCWHTFIDEMYHHDIPVYIFSNAPKDWCLNFLGKEKKIGYIYDHVPYDVDHLKPNQVAFDKVSEMFPDQKIFFIDDKMNNFVHTVGKRRWVNVFFQDPSNVMTYADKICCI